MATAKTTSFKGYISTSILFGDIRLQNLSRNLGQRRYLASYSVSTGIAVFFRLPAGGAGRPFADLALSAETKFRARWALNHGTFDNIRQCEAILDKSTILGKLPLRHSLCLYVLEIYGGRDRTRTCDLLRVKQAL